MTTFKIKLFVGKTLKDGKHPLVLQTIHDRKRKIMSLGFSTVKENWNVELSRFLPSEKNYKSKNKVLSSLEEKAEEILLSFKRESRPFTFESFFGKFHLKEKQASLFEVYKEIISELDRKEKVNTANIYKNSSNVLREFCGKRQISLYDVNYRFLKSFEAFLFEKGNTGGGVHHHMRCVRAIMNESIRRGYLDSERYPFSTQFNKNGYSLSHLKSKASPRALSFEDMTKIKNLDMKCYPHLTLSYNLFMFSYYARGMNFSDIANLKWSHIYNGRINYNRSKTSKSLNQKISGPIEEILKQYRSNNSEYIFPILNRLHETDAQQKHRIKKCLKKLNGELKEIGKICEIDIDLTSYVARHTYATTLKQKGMSVEVISEALGHSELSTTKAYLEKFSNEVLDKTDDLL